MKNLILFLIKNSFFFLFLVLEIISFLLIVSNNSYQRSSFISASNGFTSNILSFTSNATDYIGLKSENEKLTKENAILRSELLESNLWSNDTFNIYADSIRHQFYAYKEARVISNSFQNRNNYLILNKGKIDGIKAEMGVITSNGIVGIVNSVSDHFCTVISILHKKSAIDAKITSNGYTGTTFWKGGDYTHCQLKNIPSHVKVEKGDTLITSGNSTIFPPGVTIGYIDIINIEEGNNFYDIRFKFSVDYNKLSHVYIVDNLLREELKKIKEEENEY
jgi:rod shape-determining protein MreC